MHNLFLKDAENRSKTIKVPNRTSIYIYNKEENWQNWSADLKILLLYQASRVMVNITDVLKLLYLLDYIYIIIVYFCIINLVIRHPIVDRSVQIFIE